MKTLFLLLILILSACNADSQNVEVKPQPINALKLLKQFQLQEDESSPVSNIGDVSFNPSSRLFSISSPSSSKLFVFSADSGKLVKSIGTTIGFIDSIAYYQTKMWPNDKDKFYILHSEEIKNAKGKVMSESEIIKSMETRFTSATFINDSTIVGWGVINLLMLMKESSGYEKSFAAMPLFCKYNVVKDEILEAHPLTFGRSDIFPSAYMQGFCFDKEKNEVTVAIYDDESKRSNDTIRILAKFDGTGMAIKKLWLPFPQEHIKSSLGANFLNVKSCIVGNHQFAVFKTIPKIYDIDLQSSFPLSQIPKSNKTLFALSLENSKITDEALVSMIDFRMEGIYKYSNDIAVVGGYKDDDQSTVSFVQIYNVKGDLKSMYEIKDEKIKFIGFSEFDRSIVLFRLDGENGWNVTYYQINKP